jgi:hypothetical protein
MKDGDAVSFPLGDDVLIVGRLVELRPRRSLVTEVHAFHVMWGGSNACRGNKHRVNTKDLRKCPSNYKHIVDKYAPVS